MKDVYNASTRYRYQRESQNLGGDLGCWARVSSGAPCLQKEKIALASECIVADLGDDGPVKEGVALDVLK